MGFPLKKEFLTEELRKELTFIPHLPGPFITTAKPFTILDETGEELVVPFAVGMTISKSPVPPFPKLWTFQGHLQEHQERAKNRLLPVLREKGSIHIQEFNGFGKNVMIMSLLGEIGGKTLIVVPTQILVSFWVDTIKMFGQPEFFTIALQKKIPLDETFDTVLLDDADYLCGERSTQNLLKLRPKFLLIKSSSKARIDGLSSIWTKFVEM